MHHEYLGADVGFRRPEGFSAPWKLTAPRMLALLLANASP